ncbi:hypothetical protein LJB71_13240 [Thermomonas sp. S9]|nr:hypothetical protein [Thermomonas sp. S9]MCR6497089.1 hypothetical protein [Thermomonas sp. S9]
MALYDLAGSLYGPGSAGGATGVGVPVGGVIAHPGPQPSGYAPMAGQYLDLAQYPALTG